MTVGPGLYGLPEPERPLRPPSRWRWPVRIFMILLFMVGATVFALRMIGGNSEALKDSLETYLSENTGFTATIGTLNAVSFFPVLGLDLDGLTLTRNGEVAAYFGHVNFSTGLLSATFGHPALRTLDLREAEIDAGLVAPRAVELKKLTIETAEPGKPTLVLDGVYGGEKVALEVGLTVHTGMLGGASFRLGEDAKLAVRAGTIALDSVIGTGEKGQRTIRIDHFTTKPQAMPVTGEVALLRGIGDLQFEGHLATGSSRINYDLSAANDGGMRRFNGEVEAETLDLEDVFGKGGLAAHYDALRRFYSGESGAERNYDFSRTKTDISIHIKSLSQKKVPLGTVSAPMKIENGVLSFAPLTGAIRAGLLSGQARLDATQIPARLQADATITGLDYTGFSNLVKTGTDQKGLADVKMSLSSQGNHGDALWQGLDGKATVIAGPGELSSPLISLWGGGLLNAMLPSFGQGDSLSLNCGIGDFEIMGGIAKTRTFFLDTKDVTVLGEGTINLKNGMIDFRLEPEAKGAAILSAATAVRVKGPMEKPSIEPDAFSLGKKLGELLLGTINPAFLAYSLTDFGYGEQHPCQAYLKP